MIDIHNEKFEIKEPVNIEQLNEFNEKNLCDRLASCNH